MPSWRRCKDGERWEVGYAYKFDRYSELYVPTRENAKGWVYFIWRQLADDGPHATWQNGGPLTQPVSRHGYIWLKRRLWPGEKRRVVGAILKDATECAGK